MPPKPVECLRCRHYFVTYDARHPHACRYFAIQTMGLPSHDVRRSSGEECHAFQERVPRPSKDTGPPRR